MASFRKCSRTGCAHPAVATLTFAYAASTAVVGPLAIAAEPHSYDLCAEHATGLTAPKGWEVVRPDTDFAEQAPNSDDLEALADAVREAGRGDRADTQQSGKQAAGKQTGRRGHLRVLRFPED
ncbi:DUF3499 domain-containing protein [Nakamurella silvestris]|nr:DUF3499 domain-containing protein [Nakamurella silvestris]